MNPNYDDPYIKYLNRKEYVAEWRRQNRAFNNEYYRNRDREYYIRHKNDVIAKRKLYNQTNKEKIAIQRQNSYLIKKSDDEWRLRRNQRERERYAKLR